MSQQGPLRDHAGGGGNIMTLSSEGGPHTPPVGNNFNFSGSVAGGSAANGAIEFITPGGPGAATDGQMDAVVRTDNVTIHINGANNLEVIGGVFTEEFTVDAFTAPGTNPVIPNGAGNVTITGGQVAAGTTANVIRTDSLAANTYTIEVQRSQAVASSTIGDNGVSHFNSARFTVDANGFVDINGSGIGETITGDTGGALPPTAGNWNIIANHAANHAGSTVLFSGAGSTLTFNVTGSNNNQLMGDSAGNLTLSGSGNVGFGPLVLSSLTSGVGNTAVGGAALNLCTSGGQNTAVGNSALSNNSVGLNNTAIGYNSLLNATNSSNTAVGYLAGHSMSSGSKIVAIGDSALEAGATTQNDVAIGYHSMLVYNGAGGNTALGFSSLDMLTTGTTNIAIGSSSATNYTGAESNNIIIGNSGTLAESNTIRLGTQGAGAGQQNRCFVAGITGVTVSNQEFVTVDTTTGQLGVSSAGFATTYTNVNFAASPYTVLAADQYISCDTSGGAITLNFPNAPTANREWVIKDRTGNSAANNITITTPGGIVTFDGATTYLINTAYQAISLLANSTPMYEVY